MEAVREVCDGAAGAGVPTKALLKKAAKIYFGFGTEKFLPSWDTLTKVALAEAVLAAADAADGGGSVPPPVVPTVEPSPWDDPSHLGSFESALLKIKRHPTYLGSASARFKAVKAELAAAKQWTEAQGVSLEPAIRKALTELAPLKGPVPASATAVQVYGYYLEQLQQFLSSRLTSRGRRSRPRYSDESESGTGSSSDEESSSGRKKSREKRDRLRRVRKEMRVRLKLTPYEIDVRQKFLDAYEVFVADAMVSVSRDVLQHIEKEFAPKRMAFRNVYELGKYNEKHKIRVRQVYEAAAAIYKLQIQRTNDIVAREQSGAPADEVEDRKAIRCEEKMRSELRVRITLLMGEKDIFSVYHEELRGDTDLASLELAHPDASVKSLKRMRKAMIASVLARRTKRARAASGKGAGKGKKNGRTGGDPARMRCYWCNGLGHQYTKCPDKGKKKFNPKGKFASWTGPLPKGVVEP